VKEMLEIQKIKKGLKVEKALDRKGKRDFK